MKSIKHLKRIGKFKKNTFFLSIIIIFQTILFNSEKADVKFRADILDDVPLDTVYTTPSSYHHNHNHQHLQSQGSPEAMKVRMAAMILQPPTRV